MTSGRSSEGTSFGSTVEGSGRPWSGVERRPSSQWELGPGRRSPTEKGRHRLTRSSLGPDSRTNQGESLNVASPGLLTESVPWDLWSEVKEVRD